MRTKDEGSSEKQLCSIRIKSKAHPENLIYFLYKIKTFLKSGIQVSFDVPISAVHFPPCCLLI